MARIRGRRCRRSSAWNREWARQHVEGFSCSQTLDGATSTANCGPYLALKQARPKGQEFSKVLYCSWVVHRAQLDRSRTYGLSMFHNGLTWATADQFSGRDRWQALCFDRVFTASYGQGLPKRNSSRELR